MIKQMVKQWFSSIGLDISKTEVAPLPNLKYATICKFLYFKGMLDRVNHVDGDIVECGVGKGGSLVMFALLAKHEMKGRKVWGFDSFEGFPEPSSEDSSVRNAKKGMWDDTSLQGILRLLRQSELEEHHVRSQVTLVKGFFKDSLVKYTGDSIALLHIDVDLYDSYLTVLTALYPKVVKGGVILFDEYLNTSEQLYWPGAFKAIDEFLGDARRSIQRDKITGKYYLIKE